MNLTKFKTYESNDRQSPAVFYTGKNMGDLLAFADATSSDLVPVGKRDGTTFRYWCEGINDQRHVSAGVWLVIDEQGDLLGLSPEKFETKWVKIEAKNHPTTSKREKKEVLEATFEAAADALEDDGIPEMTQEEFIQRKAAKEQELRNRMDRTPKPKTKAEWLEYRVEQGYSRNQIAKLTKPILAGLPDTPPT